jgi:chromosome segregation ATPase
VYEIKQSRYGQKAITTATRNLRPYQKHFDNVVDPELKKAKQQELDNAHKVLKQHEKAAAKLQKEVDQRAAVLQEVKGRKSEVDQQMGTMRTMLGRKPALAQRLKAAQEKEAKFNTAEKKRSCQSALQKAHEASLAQTAKLIAAFAAAEKARQKADGAQLALKAAEMELEESRHESEQLASEVEQAKSARDNLKKDCQQKAKDFAEHQEKARDKAPEFEAIAKPNEGMPVDEEAQTAWNALSDDARQLEDEVEELQTDTNEDVASADAMRQYQAKEKKIEEEKERVAQTTEEVSNKQAELQATEAEWKPELARMVDSVDKSFSSYFARFNCQGTVVLSDGRARDENDTPYGEDKYQDYKIHIKVQWRNNEQLHVLGESGRDSGGERSVATMVYLISLQNINPAPFRVVDEINQAMDSSNERNVFQCITHACSQGGKQYFLLTPKLLPDLDYGEDTAIQFVYNGPYMKSRDAFMLSKFT